jgi:membrane protease subunit HflC
MSRYLITAVLVLLFLWGRSALYSVDQAEYVYVTRFGEPVVIHDGASAAGLHIKSPWPVELVERIDRRVQSFELPSVESLTRDPITGTVDKTLAVDASVTWRIPDPAAADRFFRTVRTPEQARKVLGPLVNGRLAAVISALEMDKLISVVDVQTAMAGLTGFPAVAGEAPRFMAEDVRLIDARTELVRRRLGGEGEEGALGDEALRKRVLTEYGIELIDVRVRRFSYPEAVRSSIAERIRSERAKKAADYESEGRQKAAEISSEADRVARTREADARAQKTVIEGQANADAARIRAAAYSQDREFYLFLENLRAFQTIISETRDVLLLSTKHPLMKPLAGPPEPMKKEK